MSNVPIAPVVVMRHIDELIPLPRYARKPATRAHLRALGRSIERFGFNIPILIGPGDVMITGHKRVQASRMFGIEYIPTILAAHLSEDEAALYAVADDKLGEMGEWDDKLLGQLFLDLSANPTLNLEDSGFNSAEIDIRIEGLHLFTAGDEVAPAVAVDALAVTKPNQFWIVGAHKVGCANALEPGTYECLMEGRKAALVVTDPPFNVRIQGNVGGKGRVKRREFAQASGEMTKAEYQAFLGAFMRLMGEHTVKGAVGYYFIDWRHLAQLQLAGEAVFGDPLNICVWSKDRAGMGSFYRSAHEMIVVFRTKGGRHRNNVQLGRFGRARTNIWSYPAPSNFGGGGEDGALAADHPTPKPVSMIADAILDATAPGDFVLDAFMGSGPGLLACERTRRVFRGVDLDPLYVDLAVRRWRLHTGEDAICAETGRTFTECEQDAVGADV